MTNKVLPTLVDESLVALKQDYEQHKCLDDLLLGLNSLFSSLIIENALQLIDDDSVYLIEYQQRRVLQIVGSKGDIYTILETVNFCMCDFFKYQVLKDKALCCKHVLAAKIAIIIGKYRTKIETSNGLTNVMVNAFNNVFE